MSAVSFKVIAFIALTFIFCDALRINARRIAHRFTYETIDYGMLMSIKTLAVIGENTSTVYTGWIAYSSAICVTVSAKDIALITFALPFLVTSSVDATFLTSWHTNWRVVKRFKALVTNANIRFKAGSMLTRLTHWGADR